jgi:methanogenic corrinoid protein MtbC1
MSWTPEIKNRLKEYLLTINRSKIDSLFARLLKKHNFQELVNDVIYPVMDEIGNLWENEEIALSQVYMAGRIIQDAHNKFFPKKSEIKIKRTNIALANLEDYHPMGMNIIESYLENFGIQPIVYPIGITVKELFERVIQDEIEILLISTLMLRSALKIKELTKLIKEKDLNIKVIVGGAPFNFDEELWKRVGADEVGNNAFNVIDLIRNIGGFNGDK